MPSVKNVIVDDRLLIEELLVGLRKPRRQGVLHTTGCWYYRACRAAVAGAGGHLSGPFERVASAEQDRAILSLLELRDDIGLPHPRKIVPVMAEIAVRHPRLNLPNVEAVASGVALSATVWLSAQSAEGVLPAVLEAEGVAWAAVTIS